MRVETRKKFSPCPSPKLKKFVVVGIPMVEMTPSFPGVTTPRETAVDSQEDQEQVVQVAVDQERDVLAVVAQAAAPVAVAPAAARWATMGSPEASVRQRPVPASNSLPFNEPKCWEWPEKSPRMLHFTRHTLLA